MRMLWRFLNRLFDSDPNTWRVLGEIPNLDQNHAGVKSSKCCCRPAFDTMIFSIQDVQSLRGKKKYSQLEGQNN